MAVFRCKTCGGDLTVQEGVSVVTCDFCGNQQTLPRVTDENVQALFTRAEDCRHANEFDKAEALYEKILETHPEEAEAYWGVILSKFGIEYVKDPASGEYIPTCHRASYESIAADDYYKKALEYADVIQRSLYEKDAKTIDEIQKQILEISRKEEPYDVFICYKEKDDVTGQRTRDSVRANDIYYQLTQEGYKVFYAYVTLEDKAGRDYEPIIFAALNSAKVMLVVGSKPEYFQAPWVRNEWSRYLKLMRKNRNLMMIPCYTEMDPYALPEEMSRIQAYDMSKIGFINDLIRGIKKVIPKNESKSESTPVTAASTGMSVTPLLKRAFMDLEDGNFEHADSLLEQVLNQDPENAMAYVGKLMVELEAYTMEDLEQEDETFDDELNYKKAMRFGDAALKEKLQGYNAAIRRRDAESRQEEIYEKAYALCGSTDSEELSQAAKLFASISNYRDSAERAEECAERANALVYDQACNDLKDEDFDAAREGFLSIAGYRDAAERAEECLTLEKEADYRCAMEDMEDAKKASTAAKWRVAAVSFEEIGAYRDAAEKGKECRSNEKTCMYNEALESMNTATSPLHFVQAADQFRRLGNFKDAPAMAAECQKREKEAQKEVVYLEAIRLSKKSTVQDLEQAKKNFQKIAGYKDADELLHQCNVRISELYREAEKERKAAARKKRMKPLIITAVILLILGSIIFASVYSSEIAPKKKYQEAMSMAIAGDYDGAFDLLTDNGFYADAIKVRIDQATALIDQGKTAEGLTVLENLTENYSLNDYGDRSPELNYYAAIAYKKAGKYVTAYNHLSKISYSDSAAQLKALQELGMEKATVYAQNFEFEKAYELLYGLQITDEQMPDRQIIIYLYEGNFAKAVEAGLTSIIVPNSITEITDGMFRNCQGLKSVVLPNTLTRIGDDAFEGCKALESIRIPSNVTEIGKDAFAGCTTLKEITIPPAVKTLGAGAFYGCTGLTEVVIPDTVESIGNGILYNCSALQSLTLPYVGEKKLVDEGEDPSFKHVFNYNGTNIPATLTTVLIKAGTHIGSGSFEDMPQLTSVTLPPELKVIGNSAFEDCSGLTSMVIPETVETIDVDAFCRCTGLTKLLIPSGVKTIGGTAFYGCTGLTDMQIPDSVESIGNGILYGCDALESVTLPYIGQTAEDTSPSFKHVFYYNGSKVPESLRQVTIQSGSIIGAFSFEDLGQLTSITLPYTIVTIGDSAFEDCIGLTSITLPEWLETLEVDAFRGCTGLTTMTIPASVKTIGNSAFYGCSGLTKLTIPESVESMGQGMLRECNSLAEVTVPYLGMTETGTEGFRHLFNYNGVSYPASLKSVTVTGGEEVPSNAFLDAKYIQSIDLPYTMTSIGDSAFKNCHRLWEFDMPVSMMSIGDNAFENCYSLYHVSLPTALTGIGSSAFKNCYKLVSVANYSSTLRITYGSDTQGMVAKYAIENVTTQLGGVKNDYVFYQNAGSYYLLAYLGTDTVLTLPTSVEGNYYYIVDYAFYVNKEITEVNISNGVIRIGAYAFNGCTALAKVTLGTMVQRVERQAFEGCSALTNISIPASMRHIGYRAFYGTSLTTAAFANDTGWTYSTSSENSNPTSFVPDDLSNSTTAAKYLKTNYVEKYWFCS